MLAVTDAGGRRHTGKRPKGGKKRTAKHERGSKKALVAVKEDIEDKDDSLKESLQIHELMPVTFKPEEHELTATEVTFEEATVTDQDCQSVVSTLSMDGVHNSNNKFVIITLLEPEAQGITGEELLNAAEISEVDDKLNVVRLQKKVCMELQKKVLFLHKFEPSTDSIETAPESSAQISIKHERSDLNDASATLSFSDYPPGVDGKELKDLGNWVKRFQSLPLLYTESGKAYVKCPACTAMFFKATSFEKHISSHLHKQDDNYNCNFCDSTHSDPNDIFNHLTVHQDQCEVCNMNLTRKNSFKKHWDISELSMTFTVKRDRWGRFICIYCKLGFDLCHQLQKHWFKHSCTSRKTSQCNNCTGLFDTDEALKNHVCLKCPVCGKICDSVHRLRSHTRYEKHYLYCQICSYEFILAVDHEKHMDLHKKIYNVHKDYPHCLESEDKASFQCELCGKIYHSMSCLILHIHDDHQMSNTNMRQLDSGDIARIGLPEEVDFERACEEVLEESTVEKPEDPENNEVGDQCEPVALCWNRYSLDNESIIRKDT